MLNRYKTAFVAFLACIVIYALYIAQCIPHLLKTFWWKHITEHRQPAFVSMCVGALVPAQHIVPVKHLFAVCMKDNNV